MLCAEVVDSPESGAAVERADATTRNHHVELTIFHVVTDVGNHDHHLLALQSGGTCVGRVTAVAVKCKEETRSARSCVACARTGCKGIGEVVVDGERSLAVAEAGRTAVTNALDHVIAFCESLLLGITGFCDRTALSTPCAVRLAAIPVTRTPALAATAAGLDLEIRSVALSDGAARGLCAGAGLCRGARRLGLLLLLAAGRLHAGAGLRLLRGAACRCCTGDILAVFAIGIMVAVQFAGIVIGVLFALGTSLFCVVIDALARNAVEAFSVAVARYGGRGFRLLLFGGGADNHDRGGAAQDDRRREAAGRNRGNRCAGEHGNCRAGCRRKGCGGRRFCGGGQLFKRHDLEVCRIDFKNGGAVKARCSAGKCSGFVLG